MWPRIADLAFPTPWGVAASLGLLAAWLLARSRATPAGIHTSHIDLLIPLAVGAALLVATVPGQLFHTAAAPPGIGAEQGLSLFLMLGTAVTATLAYARAAALPMLRLLDALALPAVLWLACIRVGCLMAGCCWGSSVPAAPAASTGLAHQLTEFMAVQFPPGSFAFVQQRALGILPPDATGSLPVHPVQLYESAIALALLALGSLHERKPRAAGSVCLLVLGGYAAARFLLEFLRADQVATAAAVSANQFACLFVLGAAAVVYIRRTPQAIAAPWRLRPAGRVLNRENSS